MSSAWNGILRGQLLERRERLQSAIRATTETAHLVSLLQQVDSTLERIEGASYGLCISCRQPIEEDRLLADPLVRTCLGCLTAEQRQALEQDLDLASRIQNGLLPKGRNFAGWEVCFHYDPAGPVSGDYCDLVSDESEAGSFFFLLGDVSGKGVAASLLMAHLHAIFRSLAGLGMRVDELVTQANRVFCESTIATHFATLVCGRAAASGEIEICNAGHCPPLLVRAGRVATIEAAGLPVGIFSSGQYSSERFRLAAGDSLVLYTDGVSEAQDSAQAEYGMERLVRKVKECHPRGAQQLISSCIEDVAGFRGSASNRDDLTMMVLRRVPEPDGGRE